jgi:hypothetical protein
LVGLLVGDRASRRVSKLENAFVIFDRGDWLNKNSCPTNPRKDKWGSIIHFNNRAACLRATKSPHADGSLFSGLAHLGLRRSVIFDMNSCRVDAQLTQWLDEAMATFDQLEENHALCPIEASERLVAAQRAWVRHKMTCQLCCGQQFSRVH